MGPDNPSDAKESAIVAAFENSPATAAAAVLKLYGRELRGYLVAAARDRDVGEEIYQGFSEELLRSLPRFQKNSSFRTYCYAIAYRLVSQHRKREARRRASSLDDSVADRLPAHDRTATRSWLRTDARDRLAELRDSLSTEEQTLLFLRVERAMDWKEVARVLMNDESTATVAVLRKRYERLVRKLRASIRDESG